MDISEMQWKIQKKVFSFYGSDVWTYWAKFSISQPEYLLSVGNAITSSIKISDQAIADFFRLNISGIHEKIG